MHEWIDAQSLWLDSPPVWFDHEEMTIMRKLPKPRSQKFTIIAQDPSVRDAAGRIIRAQVEVSAESLQPGPWGYRVQVVDFDAATDTLWKPLGYEEADGVVVDPFADKADAELLGNPRFHQQNVYAIVMRVLGRFEFALGRRVSWSFGGHQIKIAPHATSDANAYYSKDDEGLFFGYFVDPAFKGNVPTATDGLVFSCLSHDVVAHETTHALVDGLRRRYTDPSSPDQAAFHEGISDVVALLSVFALREVMAGLLSDWKGTGKVSAKKLKPDNLRRSALFALAEQMGGAISQARGQALRNSVRIVRDPALAASAQYQEPHRRGELLVAAMLNALIEIWSERVMGLYHNNADELDLSRVVEEGQRAADILLTMSIRALDYCPPVHLGFGDYLSALVTADREIRPDDSTYHFRARLIESFAAYGIKPSAMGDAAEPGIWTAPDGEFSHERSHFEPLQRDPDELFRFIWENRKALDLTEGVYTEVQSVRPCIRAGGDGFFLRETVAEYVQILRLMPQELEAAGYTRPDPALLPDDREVFIHGGGTLIFDEWGQLKYHVHNRLNSYATQSARIAYLAESGYYLARRPKAEAVRVARQGLFSQMHLNRGLNRSSKVTEAWTGPRQSARPVPGHVCGVNAIIAAEEEYDDANE